MQECKPRYFTAEENEFIKNNYKTMSYKEIGNVLGRKESAVSDRIRKLKLIKINKEYWTEKEISLLKSEYNKIPNIQKLFPNRSKQSIAYMAHELGLKKHNRGNYDLDVNYFKTWSNSMAYILGLIAADGNVIDNPKVFTLTLHRQDNYMLENVAREFKCERPISKRKSNCNDFVVRSAELVNDLNSLGIIPQKSLKLQWLNIPNEYLKDFVRGYIDGDGSISTYIRQRKNKTDNILEVAMLGTETFLNGMSEAINKTIGLPILKTTKPKGFINGKEFRNISKIKYSCGSAEKLLNWIYKDANLYLIRKKNVFEKYLQNR